MSSFKVQIFGAGALGSLFGALIQLSGHEVVFVARGDQLKALRNLLRIEGLMRAELKVKAKAEPEDADVTFVTVKAYDTRNAAEKLSSIDPGVVCSLQNGIGNEEILAEYFDDVVGGVTTYGANVKVPGTVVFAGKGETFIGKFKGGGVSLVEEVLESSGIAVKVVEDIKEKIWEKAVINSVINPITALFDVKNGEIVKNEFLWRLAERTAKESQKVAESVGYRFNAVEVVRSVAERTAENVSSMLQDIRRGRRTEIDYINGAIVREGEKRGVEVCYNRFLWDSVKALERVRGCRK